MRPYLIGSCLALCLAAGAPTLAYAQQGGEQAQSTAQRADREDNGEWGWLGLLGLVGLMGLKRRDRHEDIRQGHTATR
jgi:hypothetical protein